MCECNCKYKSIKVSTEKQELSVGLYINYISLCKTLQIGVGLQGHFAVR